MVQHQDAVSERHDCPHDVLDEQDGKSLLSIDLAKQRDHFVAFGGTQARHHFIKEQ